MVAVVSCEFRVSSTPPSSDCNPPSTFVDGHLSTTCSSLSTVVRIHRQQSWHICKTWTVASQETIQQRPRAREHPIKRTTAGQITNTHYQPRTIAVIALQCNWCVVTVFTAVQNCCTTYVHKGASGLLHIMRSNTVIFAVLKAYVTYTVL